MKKDVKKTLIITTIVTLLPILIGLFLWNQLPDRVATHFDMEGAANGWSSKAFAVFGLPIFIALINVFCTVFTEKDPRRAKYPEKMMKLVYWICPVVSWVCAVAVYGHELGMGQKAMLGLIYLFVGCMFIVVGNYLPKVKQNYYLGIKLPWTYADEENWNKTHRMAGKLWVAGGILFLLNFFLRIKWLELWVMIVMVVIPCIYSWAYSRKKEK